MSEQLSGPCVSVSQGDKARKYTQGPPIRPHSQGSSNLSLRRRPRVQIRCCDANVIVLFLARGY